MSKDINHICKVLSTDFDTSILDEASDSIKQEFKNTSKKFKDGKEGNIPLLNAIHNHFNGVLPTHDYISGPMSLVYYTSKQYNMNIYIFGEAHGTDNNCRQLKKRNYITIPDYLHQLFLNSDKFIDFYLEDVMFRSLSTEGDFMNMIRNDLTNCLNPIERHKCPYKTVRTHFVDARFIQRSKNIITSTTEIGRIISYLLEETPKKPANMKKVLDKIASLDTYEKLCKYVISIALNIPIIKKELSRCYLDKKVLMTIFSSVILDNYKKMIPDKDWLIINKPLIPKTTVGSILVSIEVPIVDFYTITRMFKIFKPDNYFPPKQRNIIYYAGDNHASIIRNFLTKLGFKKQFSRESRQLENFSRCLDMRKIQLDFK